MTTIAVRLPDELLEALDAIVEQARYPNRTAVVRSALEQLVAAECRRATDAAIEAGYKRVPPDRPSEYARSLAHRSVAQEPW